ncbi:hypothetical protein [Haloactinopolyspora alba]|uniref:hypothetical protein n=1 Tax=Haloactinopolyspora alba TaxID=648780 RepID=UPI00101B82F2|nr:hypothetical protein [Haloactinopolyspora alba]
MSEVVDGRRRRLLVAAAAVPLAGAVPAACGADSAAKTAPGSRARLDADVKVRWRAVRAERVLLRLHRATVESHPDLADTLAPLTARHEEHLATLESGGPLPYGTTGLPAADVPGDAAAALDAVVEAEAAAGRARVQDCAAATGPRLAALLASVAACESGHAAVLESG